MTMQDPPPIRLGPAAAPERTRVPGQPAEPPGQLVRAPRAAPEAAQGRVAPGHPADGPAQALAPREPGRDREPAPGRDQERDQEQAQAPPHRPNNSPTRLRNRHQLRAVFAYPVANIRGHTREPLPGAGRPKHLKVRLLLTSEAEVQPVGVGCAEALAAF